MRDFSRTLLTLLASLLALWLVWGFWPLSNWNRVVLSLSILLIGGALLWRGWRQARRRRAVSAQLAENHLPPEDYQGAVVLVCGDTAALFMPGMPYRESRQGWYLHVENAGQLPLLAQHLAAARPALVSQISVLLAVLPEQQTSEERLAQSLRGWHRSIVQCRTWLNGLPPVWSVTWISPPDSRREAAAQWFTVTPELPGVRVRPEGQVAQPVASWQQEVGADASRFYTALWLDGALAFLEQRIGRLFNARQGELPPLTFCATGVCLATVAGSADNLWQRQIADVTTLAPGYSATATPLPLPDVLLPFLPRRHGVSRRMQDIRLVGALVFVFLSLAMAASFINNQRLIRSVGDHLALYHRLSGTPVAPKLQAQERLRADSRRLDEWLRRGEPLRYGLGLYQGMRLIPPLEAAINSWSPPPRPVITTVVQGPQTIQLDSMSLFDSGQWRLKPGSTKVLVNALVGIRAKPGWLIVVAGHTDSTGDERANQALSLKRAGAVRDWMRDTGDVPESCFAVQGYGESRPVATNDTAEGRALNRRVEISLVPQAGACRLPEQPSAPLQGENLVE
jgi:outer membrane protein OmpA-like peptidoglycan-associated protein